jgi:hypothetical protein
MRAVDSVPVVHSGIQRSFVVSEYAVGSSEKRVEETQTYILRFLLESQDDTKPSSSSMAVVVSSVVVRKLMWQVGGNQTYFYPAFRNSGEYNIDNNNVTTEASIWQSP